MARAALLIISLLLLLYPIGVYFGLQHLQPRDIALLLIILLGLRFTLAYKHFNRKNLKSLMPLTLSSGLLCLLILIFNQTAMIRLTPVLINMVLLASFAHTLYSPPSMIERLARLSGADISGPAIAYTRTVTVIWCFFFLLNGSIALYTCFFTSLETWTLYNGLIAYLLIGLLFLAEYCIRQQRIRKA